MDNTKPCPACGKKMIRRNANYVLCTYPPIQPWDWWCACGHTEKGGEERGKTNEEILREQWEIAQHAQDGL